MQFTIDQQAFLEGLRTVVRAVGKNHAITALTGISLEATQGNLLLRATDLELSIETCAPASVTAEGALVLPGRELFELVSRFPSAPVSFTADPQGATARLTCGRAEYTARALPNGHFPGYRVPAGVQGVAIHWARLRRLLRETGSAVPPDEQPTPWFTGMVCSVRGDQAVILATDDAAAAMSETPVSNPQNLTFTVAIPGRAVHEVARLLAESEADLCELFPLPDRLLFRLNEVTVMTRLLDRSAFQPALPTQYHSTVSVDRDRLLEACERAALVSKDGTLRLDSQAGGLWLTAASPEAGRIAEGLPAVLEGPAFRTRLKARHVLAALRAQDGREVVLEYAGSQTALRLRSRRCAAGQPCFAVMPVPDPGAEYVAAWQTPAE